MFVPLLVKPPKGRPAKVLGGSAGVLQIVQQLMSAGWLIEVHEAEKHVGGLEGVKFSDQKPPQPSLRQASLVLIGAYCPDDWREEALATLEGTGVPYWDERDIKHSTLQLPLWLRGKELSFAAWPPEGTFAPWKEVFAEELLGMQENLLKGFVKLVNDVGGLVFSNSTEDDFLKKAAAQLATPSIISALASDDYMKAKTMALKIVGATTRSLD